MFGHVLARLDPAAFENCLLGWIRAVQEVWLVTRCQASGRPIYLPELPSPPRGRERLLFTTGRLLSIDPKEPQSSAFSHLSMHTLEKAPG